MTLELVDGVDLRSLLKAMPEQKLPPDWVALIALDLAYALEHAHGTLVHRDLSPSNILVSRSGEAKLADFGVAKALEQTSAPATRSAKGKVPYMCPERIRGEPIDARADLFSLGVVLFEAAAGVRPFDGAHDVETMQRILSGTRASLDELAPALPRELRRAIERLIEVDPSRRTPTAETLLDELAAVAPPPSTRRALAGTVEGYRGGPRARLHVQARERERDTELSPTPGVEGVRAKPIARPWRTVSGLFVVALTAVLAALLLDGMRASPAPPARDAVARPSPTAPASEPMPGPSDALPPPVAPIEPPSEKQTRARPAASKANRGWLNVVVEPWGNVWIDDVWMGRAPVEARLKKGRHVVKVGRDLPTKTKVVRVEAGARKEVELELTE